MPVDPETLSALQALVGEQYGIPEGLRVRLRGDSLAALRADATQLREALGMPPLGNEVTTDDQAQTVSDSVGMTKMIRQAAGRA